MIFHHPKGGASPSTAVFRFKAKIANAEQLRVHTMLVIGARDLEAGAVSVRLHHGGPQGAKLKGEVIAKILADIKERKA